MPKGNKWIPLAVCVSAQYTHNIDILFILNYDTHTNGNGSGN